MMNGKNVARVFLTLVVVGILTLICRTPDGLRVLGLIILSVFLSAGVVLSLKVLMED